MGQDKTVTQDVAIVLLLMGNWPLQAYRHSHGSHSAYCINGAYGGKRRKLHSKNTAVFKSGDAFKEKTENDAEAARKKVCRQLLEGGITVSAAESFLLAAVSSQLVSRAGMSASFLLGIVAYTDNAKSRASWRQHGNT